MLDDPAAARNATKVNLPNAPAGLSDNYAGFVTTDADTDSNMFFWFFEALNGDKDAPVVVWLQGSLLPGDRVERGKEGFFFGGVGFFFFGGVCAHAVA